jgi:hypothetical protein
METTQEHGYPITEADFFNPKADTGNNFALAPAAMLQSLAANLASRQRDPPARVNMFKAAGERIGKLKANWTTDRRMRSRVKTLSLMVPAISAGSTALSAKGFYSHEERKNAAQAATGARKPMGVIRDHLATESLFLNKKNVR